MRPSAAAALPDVRRPNRHAARPHYPPSICLPPPPVPTPAGRTSTTESRISRPCTARRAGAQPPLTRTASASRRCWTTPFTPSSCPRSTGTAARRRRPSSATNGTSCPCTTQGSLAASSRARWAPARPAPAGARGLLVLRGACLLPRALQLPAALPGLAAPPPAPTACSNGNFLPLSPALRRTPA